MLVGRVLTHCRVPNRVFVGDISSEDNSVPDVCSLGQGLLVGSAGKTKVEGRRQP